jgi:dTDP-4-amino-4,6-dideoxygalactose transaminase
MLDLRNQYNSIKAEIDDAIENVISETAFIGGKYVQLFEKEFSEYVGNSYCIGVGNGTDALEIAIEALELPKNSEIIVPANTFIASAEAITRTGHKVVFCDCNDTYTIDIEDLKKKITSHTRALIAVHLYGQPCDMDAIKKITAENNIRLIEDCAQAHGAKYNEKNVGTFGDIAAFSFYPGKNLGAYGDAGAVITQNFELSTKVRMIANHGRIDKYNHEFEGRNSRLDGIQAAILSVKLRHLEEWTQQRIVNATFYKENLYDCKNLILPQTIEDAKHVYHLFVIRAENRDGLQKFLFNNGVETGIHYPIALPKLNAYRYLNNNISKFKAVQYEQELLSLPIGEHLDENDQKIIVSMIKEFLKRT